MPTMLKFYRNNLFRLYFSANTKVLPKVYLLVGNTFNLLGEMKQIDSRLFVFEDIKETTGEYLYKIECEFTKYVRVFIEDNLIDKIYNHTFGNWEIKNNQMIFYDLDGNVLAKYNLYDKDGNPTDESVYLRKKVDN